MAKPTVSNWTSTNTDVATVDENGLVTIVGLGTTMIGVDTVGGGGFYTEAHNSFMLFVNDVPDLVTTPPPSVPVNIIPIIPAGNNVLNSIGNGVGNGGGNASASTQLVADNSDEIGIGQGGGTVVAALDNADTNQTGNSELDADENEDIAVTTSQLAFLDTSGNGANTGGGANEVAGVGQGAGGPGDGNGPGQGAGQGLGPQDGGNGGNGGGAEQLAAADIGGDTGGNGANTGGGANEVAGVGQGAGGPGDGNGPGQGAGQGLGPQDGGNGGNGGGS